jgi:hypothetical protein
VNGGDEMFLTMGKRLLSSHTARAMIVAQKRIMRMRPKPPIPNPIMAFVSSCWVCSGGQHP